MAPMTTAERLKAMLVAEIDRHAPEIDARRNLGHVTVSWTRQHDKPPVVEFTMSERRVAREWGSE